MTGKSYDVSKQQNKQQSQSEFLEFFDFSREGQEYSSALISLSLASALLSEI